MDWLANRGSFIQHFSAGWQCNKAAFAEWIESSTNPHNLCWSTLGCLLTLHIRIHPNRALHSIFARVVRWICCQCSAILIYVFLICWKQFWKRDVAQIRNFKRKCSTIDHPCVVRLSNRLASLLSSSLPPY